jgi:hypothetical protein
MHPIDQSEFELSVKKMGCAFSTEIAWYKHGPLFGVVLFDDIDKDWSWVALAPGDYGYVVIELGHSHQTETAATETLASVLILRAKS